MKPNLIVISLFAFSATAPASEIPPDFRARIAYQTPQEWQAAISSSHGDLLKDALPDSPLLGRTPAAIAGIGKIVVGVPQPDVAGTRLEAEFIFSAIHDYVLEPPKPHAVAEKPVTRRWIDVTGSEKQEYRIIFINGVPSELYLRKNPQTLERFSLKKKQPN